MPNAYQNVGAGSSLEQAIAMFNNNFAKLDNEAVTKVFRGAGGINAFTLGQIKDVGVGLILRDQNDIPRIACYIDSTGTPILKVSKDGFDVLTTGDENLIFNSAQNVFKIVASGTSTHTLTNAANVVTAGLQTITIPHGLSFTPAFLVYDTAPSGFVDGNVLFMLPHMTYNSTPDAGSVFTYFYATADSTNLYINYKHRSNTDYSPSLPTFTVRYYLYQETAN